MEGLYSITTLVCAAVLIITNFRKETYQTSRADVDKRYARLVAWLILFCFIDAAWGLFADAQLENSAGLCVFSVLVNLGVAVTGCFWTSYVVRYMEYTKLQSRVFMGIAYCLVALTALLLVAGLAGGSSLFYIDEQGIYQADSLRAFGFVIRDAPYVALGIFAVYDMLQHEDRLTSRLTLVLLFVVAPIAASLIQLAFPFAPLFTIGYMLGCCIINAVLVYSGHEKLKQAEYRKQRERDAAEAANRAKTEFLFNMSHDIRTPMNAIMGYSELLERHGDDPQARTEYIRKIQDSNEHLLSLINNVLEMSRIESGKLALKKSVGSMEEICESIYSVFQPSIKKKQLLFERSCRVQNDFVLCDVTKLREIFMNIVSNAVEYTPAGGTVSLSMEELPSGKEGYGSYKVVVSDTGVGMSQEFLPTLFEEFSRERNTTESGVQGSGLGMAIAKRLVDLMGGSIEVESELGKGSTFTVILPLELACEDRAGDATAEAGDSADDSLIGKRILLAEDNDLNAEIAVMILQEFGFEVEHANDGDVCVRMLAESAPGYYDIILMDIQMPRMNGYEATRQIRQLEDPDKADIPIVAMTANAFEEDRRNAIEAGMNGHVAKPIEMDLLMQAIREAVGNRAQPGL